MSLLRLRSCIARCPRVRIRELLELYVVDEASVPAGWLCCLVLLVFFLHGFFLFSVQVFLFIYRRNIGINVLYNRE